MDSKPTYEALQQRVDDLEQEALRFKQASAMLRDSEKRYLALFANMSEGVCVHELVYDESNNAIDYVITDVNPSYEMITGIKKAFAVGVRASVLYKTGVPPFLGIYTEAVESGLPQKFDAYFEPMGKHFHISAFGLGGRNFATVFMDITEIKLKEQSLRESEERYRTVADFNYDWEHWYSPDGKFIYVSPSCERITGYAAQNFIEDPSLYLGVVHPDDQAAVAAHLNGDLEAETDYHLEFRIVDRDGSEHWISHYCVPVFDHEGNWLGRRGSNRDITTRKRDEAKLRESEERYRMLFNSGYDAVLVHGVGSDLLPESFSEVNEVACRMLGYTKEELLQLTPQDVGVPQGAREASQILEKLLGSGNVLFERTLIAKDGRKIPVETNATLFDLAGRKTVMCVTRDITERKEAEKDRKRLEIQLREAQKMEAIGTLAGGIAHDFNNILSPIIIHTEIAMAEIASDNPLQNNLRKIFKASLRAKDLVKQILMFSRQNETELKPLKLSSIIKEVIKLMRASLPSTIHIREHMQARPDFILADPIQIHQVLMNLCTNAFHAMRKVGGTLGVDLENVTLDDEDRVQFPELNPGRYIRLQVSDTGHGMVPAVMARIFDPYFTTKRKGEGTGLGLSVVHGIVKSHGGLIQVQSRKGQGTVFTLLFPMVAPSSVPVDEAEQPIVGGNERILVVDDEKQIVMAMEMALKRLGYTVTAHNNSREALAEFQKNPGRFDLIITDMTMPELTGKELVTAAKQIRADIPVILCTGFSEDIDAAAAAAMGIDAFLMKPIVRPKLAAEIRGVLAKKA